MSYALARESFASLTALWKDANEELAWEPLFVVPGWMEVWRRSFAPDTGLYLASVRDSGRVIGIAPLRVKDGLAGFVGSPDVCDYLDFIVQPGYGAKFFSLLLADLAGMGVRRLELAALREDSIVLRELVPLARERGLPFELSFLDVSVETVLPPSWEGYLSGLPAKQRHEIERKLRRLYESGIVDYRYIEQPAEVPQAMDTFFRLFALSRPDKAAFMDERMTAFFRSLTGVMAELGLLRLGMLELDGNPVASVLTFDYKNRVYLYNSGYDPAYRYLSAGLISKVLAIRDSIRRRKQVFDFLKGGEEYKFRLGGREVPLYRCRIELP